MYQGLQFPLCLSPPLTLNRNQKIWKQILSSVLLTKNQNPIIWNQTSCGFNLSIGSHERDFDLPGSFKGSNVIDWKVKG